MTEKMLPKSKIRHKVAKKTIHMQIITKISTVFNTLTEIIIYGPVEIPVGHKLYNRKLYRHGFYTRKLILSNRIQVTFVIFRFCEKIGERYVTYSLLPFCISPFQRHINSIIDQVLEFFFFEHKSMSCISDKLDISLPTIRRWISRFADKALDIEKSAEKAIVDSRPGYRAVSYSADNMFSLARSVFGKVFKLAQDKTNLIEYGIVSWINLKIRPFLGKLDNIAGYG